MLLNIFIGIMIVAAIEWDSGWHGSTVMEERNNGTDFSSNYFPGDVHSGSSQKSGKDTLLLWDVRSLHWFLYLAFVCTVPQQLLKH